MAKGAFGGAQSLFFIRNCDLCLGWENSTESVVGTLVRPREKSPGIRKALYRRCDDAQADHNHQGDEPARMEDISQAGEIEEAEH